MLGSTTPQDLYVHKWSVSEIRSNKVGRRRRVFSFVEEGVVFVALMFMSRESMIDLGVLCSCSCGPA